MKRTPCELGEHKFAAMAVCQFDIAIDCTAFRSRALIFNAHRIYTKFIFRFSGFCILGNLFATVVPFMTSLK